MKTWHVMIPELEFSSILISIGLTAIRPKTFMATYIDWNENFAKRISFLLWTSEKNLLLSSPDIEIRTSRRMDWAAHFAKWISFLFWTSEKNLLLSSPYIEIRTSRCMDWPSRFTKWISFLFWTSKKNLLLFSPHFSPIKKAIIQKQ